MASHDSWGAVARPALPARNIRPQRCALGNTSAAYCASSNSGRLVPGRCVSAGEFRAARQLPGRSPPPGPESRGRELGPGAQSKAVLTQPRIPAKMRRFCQHRVAHASLSSRSHG